MNVIYEPKGRAREYSPLAANLYTGCANRCSYCYGPGVLRMNREDYYAAEAPRAGVIEALYRDAELLYDFYKNPEILSGKPQVLLSFIGDPYCRANQEHQLTKKALGIFIERRIPAAVLSKAGSAILWDLDYLVRFGQHIKVGQSITLMSESASREWEPGAALPEDRLWTFEVLHQHGVPTWASLEPVIDPEQSLQMIEASIGFVDEYRLGKLNHDPERAAAIDWENYLTRALHFLRAEGKRIYVKEDLRAAAPGVQLAPEEIEMDRWNAAWGKE